MKLHQTQKPVTGTAKGIDRFIRNVQTGRFERSLSGLTAGALVTAAEIYLEHDKANFGNPWMWVPMALGPVGAAAGVAGVFSRSMAKTALPLASTAIIANGLQGTWLHLQGIRQKPGGLSNLRSHLEWFHDHVRIENLFFDGTLDPDGGTVRPSEAPGNGLAFRAADAAPYRVH